MIHFRHSRVTHLRLQGADLASWRRQDRDPPPGSRRRRFSECPRRADDARVRHPLLDRDEGGRAPVCVVSLVRERGRATGRRCRRAPGRRAGELAPARRAGDCSHEELGAELAAVDDLIGGASSACRPVALNESVREGLVEPQPQRSVTASINATARRRAQQIPREARPILG